MTKLKKLPPHPKKHHLPFRPIHVALFLAGLLIGLLGTYRGGYIQPREFDVNESTPAVVKIYHLVCGTLKYQGQAYGENTCDAAVGTGFLISKDGYIATSGHVVVHHAADIMARELQANPFLLNKFAADAKFALNPAKGESNESAFLRKLYDLSEEQLKLENRREIILAALSDRPLIVDEDNPQKVFELPDSDYIKKAEVVATDYASQDLLTLNSTSNEGFSAHDVALLKINAREAPVLALGDAAKVHQNDPITLVGFPYDADNQLTANNIITPSVTNGNISSIRTTSGKISRLFQSDADASQGNSGGPALNQKGQVIGIVTYRFKDDEAANAAKSYIREVNDLKELLKSRSIVLRTDSKATDHWQKGLELAGQNKYSQAVEQYRLTLQEYPAHRLARSYITQAEEAIKEGQDVKDPPYTLLITIGAIIGGVSMIIVSAVLISHHRLQHHRYKKSIRSV
ncbi:serine protease [Candidatus Parcubacteria bacterium]|nr:serine protease [Candidatus Parcubacteria bacterium]